MNWTSVWNVSEFRSSPFRRLNNGRHVTWSNFVMSVFNMYCLCPSGIFKDILLGDKNRTVSARLILILKICSQRYGYHSLHKRAGGIVMKASLTKFDRRL